MPELPGEPPVPSDTPSPVAAASPRDRLVGGARRLLAARALRRGAIALAALAVVAWAAVPVVVQRVAESEGTAALGRAVTIERVRFNPLTLLLQVDGVRVAGAKAADPPAVTLQHAEADLEWSSAWHRAPVLSALRVQAPELHVARLGDGRFDVDDVLARLAHRPPSPPSSEPARFALYNVEVADGRVVFDDRPAGRVHRLEGLALGLPFLSDLPGDAEIKVRPHLRFALDGATYDTAAQATPFRAERAGTLSLHTGEIDLAPWLPYWPAALGVKPLQGRVQADLALDFDARPGQVPAWSVNGRVGVDRFALADAQGRSLLAWRHAAVVADALRPLQRRVDLRAVTLDGLDLDVARDAHGQLSLLQAFAPQAASAPAPAPSTPKTPSPAEAPWQVRVGEFELTDARIGWRDARVAPAVAGEVREARLRVERARWPWPVAASAAVASAALPASAASGPAPFAADAMSVALQARWVPAVATAAAAASAAASAPPTLRVAARADAAHGSVDAQLDGLVLAPLRPYLAAAGWRPATDGTVAAAVRASWRGAPGDGLPTIEDAHASIDGLKLVDASGAPPALAWTRAQLEGVTLDPATRRVTIGAVTLTQPALRAVRDANGVVNATAWLAGPGSSEAPSPAASGPAWSVRLAHLGLDDARVQWRDAAVPAGAVALDLDRMKLGIDELAWPGAGGTPAHVTLAARLRPGERTAGAGDGKLVVDARVALPAPPAAAASGVERLTWQARVNAERLPVHALDAYLADASPVALDHADAGWRGEVQGGWSDAGLRLRARGDVVVTDLHAHARRLAVAPGGAPDDLVAWQSLALKGLDATLAPGRPPAQALALAIEDVRLVGASARLVVTEQGHFNLTDLAPPEAAASAPVASAASGGATVVATAAPVAAAASAAPAPLPDIRIGHVAWVDAHVDYTDRFVQPHYSTDLSALNGELGAVSTRSTDLAPLRASGRVAGTGALAIDGRVNPLGRPLALDIAAHASDIELAPLSPYAGKYAGYAIERGKLSVDLRYRIQPDGRLEASNRVVLNQLTFGEHVESADATKLPVLFAVALLKDRHGVIDVDLPVGGSLDDPKFSVGGIVWKLVLNLLGKALTSPFALLAGGGGDDLQQVLFVPGTARLQPDAERTLDRVAKALDDHPGLQLTVTGLADDDQERAAMQAAQVESRLVAMRRSERLQAGEAPASAASAPAPVEALAPADRTRLVKRLYDDTKLPDKPRNLVGMAKDLPEADMTARLVAGQALPPDAARTLAVERGRVVRDALVARGLPNERLFVAAPKMHGAGGAEPEAWLPHAQLALSAR